MSPETDQSLQRLMEAWQSIHRPRAMGGRWALSGFAFQSSTFLLSFFKQIKEGKVEPGQLAEMERLSDILCPEDGKVRVVQVKSTLASHDLSEAVAEAYLITRLCLEVATDLTGDLCFQIACRNRATDLLPTDLSPTKVVGEDYDPAVWEQTLAQFDPDEPILLQADPLGALHWHLWHWGIADPAGLVEHALGLIFSHFGTTDPSAISRLSYDLNGLFVSAHPTPGDPLVGSLLTQADVAPDQDTEDKGVLTGQTARFEHLRCGYFRQRPGIFDYLQREFREWLKKVSAATGVPDKIPVFWISGRSGEGKSVLLLQLAAALLEDKTAPPLLHLTAQDLVTVLKTAPTDRRAWGADGGPLIALVDDVYNVSDRETWCDNVRDSCALEVPPVCLLTCGPTEQFEQFEHDLGPWCHVAKFEVPHLAVAECAEFLAWYQERTGTEAKIDPRDLDNTLLVLFIFELAQGDLQAFARRFRQRLELGNVFDEARTIAAVNALYMDAPLSIVTSVASRDALERLCEDDQLHFQVSDDKRGVRLYHPHIAWRLFVEWAAPYPGLGEQWARELHKALRCWEAEGNELAASNLIYQLLVNAHLSGDATTNDGGVTADRRATVRELYRLHVFREGGHPSLATLPRWLEPQYKIPDLGLTPDPTDFAIEALSDDVIAERLRGDVAFWCLLLAQRGSGEWAERLRAAAQRFYLRYPDRPGTCNYIVRAAQQRAATDGDRLFPTEWINAHPTHPQAYDLIAFLMAADPAFARKRELAQAWLDANRDDPKAYTLLISLVVANPTDADVRKSAEDWLDANADHPQAYQVIAPLLKANPTDEAVRNRAEDWLDANQVHPQVYWLIAPLVAANPTDAAARKRAEDWLDANRDHPQAQELLRVLVAAHPTDEGVRKRAEDWLDANAEHPQTCELLRALVAANPTDAAVRKLAEDWLDANAEHPQTCELLKALVAANPTEEGVLKRAEAWLDANPEHPHRREVLGTAIARSDGDASWLARGEQYLSRPEAPHPESILAVMLSSTRAAPRYVDLALTRAALLPKRHRDFVLAKLAQALVYNPESALRCLDEARDVDRKTVLQNSIAVGLRKYSPAVPAFVEEAMNHMASDDLYQILKRVVQWSAEADELDAFIANWLVDNWRRHGYRRMLRDLAERQERWDLLVSTGLLSDEVIADYEAMGHGSD